MRPPFTAGPWRIEGPNLANVFYVMAGEDIVVAEVDNYNNEGLGDISLIAAAPELYDGCNALLGLIQLLAANPDTPPALLRILTENHRIAEAEAAVAKARGDQVQP